MKQIIYENKTIIEALIEINHGLGRNIKWLIVCDEHLMNIDAVRAVNNQSMDICWYSDFTPNPTYEAVEKAIDFYKENGCGGVLAIGGGSAMDLAKCVKLYATLDPEQLYLDQEYLDNDIPLVAVPTTAGTGSEATRYAVIYYKGVKQSVTHNSIVPEYVIFEPAFLRGLPDYQKKATAMDAMCHAIESTWSVNSTEESRQYSKEAIRLLLKNIDAYISGDENSFNAMLMAANLAGKAINITQTTAGHAMCYKITSLFGFSHGHAAAICVRRLWPYMLEHTDACIDPRGEKHLKEMFSLLDEWFGGNGAAVFEQVCEALDFEKKATVSIEMMNTLIESVNPTRLKNNPIKLDTEDLNFLYKNILSDIKNGKKAKNGE